MMIDWNYLSDLECTYGPTFQINRATATGFSRASRYHGENERGPTVL